MKRDQLKKKRRRDRNLYHKNKALWSPPKGEHLKDVLHGILQDMYDNNSEYVPPGRTRDRRHFFTGPKKLRKFKGKRTHVRRVDLPKLMDAMLEVGIPIERAQYILLKHEIKVVPKLKAWENVGLPLRQMLQDKKGVWSLGEDILLTRAAVVLEAMGRPEGVSISNVGKALMSVTKRIVAVDGVRWNVLNVDLIESLPWVFKARDLPPGCVKPRPKARPSHRLACAVRQRLKYSTGRTDTLQVLGCSWGELEVHIESQFDSEMSWLNWGRKGWLLSFVIPLSDFDLEDNDQVGQAFNWSNLCPRWR